MNESMIALSILVVALGVYATYQHSVIVRYRKWSARAQALLITMSMEKAMAEYGFDEEEKADD